MPMFNFLGKCGPSGNSTGHTYLWGYSAHFTDTQILLAVSVLSPKNSHLAVEFLLLWDNSLDLALELVNLELETIDTLLPTHNSLNSMWWQRWHNVSDKPISELPLITATTPCGLRGIMRPWFDFWFWCYIQYPFFFSVYYLPLFIWEQTHSISRLDVVKGD